MNILEVLQKLRQLCDTPALLGMDYKSAKFEAFKQLIPEITEKGHKVVVFSSYVSMLKLMREYFDNETDLKYAYLDGSIKGKDRQNIIDQFETDQTQQIFLGSLKACNAGFNILSANHGIIYDPWWNPSIEDQAAARMHRIGQDKDVLIYKLYTEGTVEEKMLQLQNAKRELIKATIKDEATGSRNINKEDLLKALMED
jgi:SNF2 family DNA or RNA helicase